mmetsp:Transcript_15359/g.47766  ORF Transcript_15359/g.47766 Transcript_15359/m.47766 type:complete len:605 (+) Transcript_15359:1967-3781(+)
MPSSRRAATAHASAASRRSSSMKDHGAREPLPLGCKAGTLATSTSSSEEEDSSDPSDSVSDSVSDSDSKSDSVSVSVSVSVSEWAADLALSLVGRPLGFLIAPLPLAPGAARLARAAPDTAPVEPGNCSSLARSCTTFGARQRRFAMSTAGSSARSAACTSSRRSMSTSTPHALVSVSRGTRVKIAGRRSSADRSSRRGPFAPGRRALDSRALATSDRALSAFQYASAPAASRTSYEIDPAAPPSPAAPWTASLPLALALAALRDRVGTVDVSARCSAEPARRPSPSRISPATSRPRPRRTSSRRMTARLSSTLALRSLPLPSMGLRMTTPSASCTSSGRSRSFILRASGELASCGRGTLLPTTKRYRLSGISRSVPRTSVLTAALLPAFAAWCATSARCRYFARCMCCRGILFGILRGLASYPSGRAGASSITIALSRAAFSFCFFLSNFLPSSPLKSALSARCRASCAWASPSAFSASGLRMTYRCAFAILPASWCSILRVTTAPFCSMMPTSRCMVFISNELSAPAKRPPGLVSRSSRRQAEMFLKRRPSGSASRILVISASRLKLRTSRWRSNSFCASRPSALTMGAAPPPACRTPTLYQ